MLCSIKWYLAHHALFSRPLHQKLVKIYSFDSTANFCCFQYMTVPKNKNTHTKRGGLGERETERRTCSILEELIIYLYKVALLAILVNLACISNGTFNIFVFKLLISKISTIIEHLEAYLVLGISQSKEILMQTFSLLEKKINLLIFFIHQKTEISWDVYLSLLILFSFFLILTKIVIEKYVLKIVSEKFSC